MTGSNGFDQENYNISYATGDLTINRRAITLTASGQEKIYGDELTLDDTAFTTLDKDGDSVLPNGEVITNVSIQSATDKDASTTADVATYENEIEIYTNSCRNSWKWRWVPKVTMTLRTFQAI